MPKPLYKTLNLSKRDFREYLLKEYVDNGLSQAKIAKKLGCHVCSIENWFKKFNISLRTQSEALAKHWERHVNLTTNEREQMYGWLLSDGSLESSKHSARFTIGLKYKTVINDIVHSLSSLQFTPIWASSKTNCFHVKSHSYNNLKKMHEKWYCNGRKHIPSDLSLTPTVVYYWFLGDGSRVPHGIQLSTESFSRKEVKKLSEMLQEINFDNSVLKSNRIRIKSASVKSFYEYIGPCRHGVYQYKWRIGR